MINFLSWFSPTELIKDGFKWTNRSRPVINFEYDLGFPGNEYCHFRTISDMGHVNGLFFRLGINNLGNKRIEEADVMVEKIEIINREGKREVVSSSSFFLHWANENTDNSRSIYSHTPVFVDLIYTVENKPGMAFFFPKQKHAGAGIKEFLTPHKWVITIKLLGSEIKPLQKEVEIDFNGKWNQIKLRLL
jgi:hypothetical protein